LRELFRVRLRMLISYYHRVKQGLFTINVVNTDVIKQGNTAL